MEDPMGDMVISDHVEDLSFIDVPGIGPGMENTVRVHGKGRPVPLKMFLAAADGLPAFCRMRPEVLFLLGRQSFFNLYEIRILFHFYPQLPPSCWPWRRNTLIFFFHQSSIIGGNPELVLDAIFTKKTLFIPLKIL
jgi:hypothetical protein